MKTSVKNIFFALGATAMLASCSENSWNDHLEGFEPGVNYNNALEAAYTMTSADYSAVASNSTNKELAESAGLANALKAVGTNAMFSAEIPARQYLPAYLASSSAPYFVAPEGSKVNVTYDETGETDPIIAQIAGATTYTVSKNDYINAWGSEVDYISAFAPMTSAENKLPGILKAALPDAAEGAYAVVSYNESNTNPVFLADSDVEEFIGGTYYLVADGTVGAAPFKYTYTYGNLSNVDVTVSNGTVDTDPLNAFSFAPTEGGYYMIDVYGRYLYQSGTYNNFNVSYTVPTSGGIWTVDVASNGAATIVNNDTEKTVQYSGGKWGAFKDVTGSLPVLYKAQAPQFYIVADDSHILLPLNESYNYGYPKSSDTTVANGAVTTNAANAFTFEITNGGYYIKDCYDRYLYNSGTFKSINVSKDVPEEGAVWTVTTNEDASVSITNVLTGRWFQYDTSRNNWAVYDTQDGINPKMYNAAVKAVASSKPSRVVAGTPATTGKNAVYQYDGKAWAVAEGVSVLNPADYTDMGFDANKLEEPEVYLPMYLKANKPYAVAGDLEAVVYNGTSCAVLVYDGQNWTVNDNGKQTVTAQFVKKGDDWSFVKYVGKSIFDLTEELILDRQYLLVAEAICATPISTSKTYNYLYTAPVKIDKGTIVQENEVNAFTFATTAVVDDKEYALPEGQFFIVDSNNRYLYMSGTYNSFNVTAAPVVKDGVVDTAYAWTAEHNGDGVWTIKNVGNGKWIQYSISYSSFGCYDAEQSNAVLPSLYVIEVAE